MPAGKARFGSGSLVGPVAPLPDDDEDTPAAVRPPAVEPATSARRAAAPAPVRVERPAAPPRAIPSRAAIGRERPPATLRLNEAAAAALWEAFLVAKAADPFLSYRQFASTVVLQGLRRGR